APPPTPHRRASRNVLARAGPMRALIETGSCCPRPAALAVMVERTAVRRANTAKANPASAPTPAASCLDAAADRRAAMTPPTSTATSGASRNRKYPGGGPGRFGEERPDSEMARVDGNWL